MWKKKRMRDYHPCCCPWQELNVFQTLDAARPNVASVVAALSAALICPHPHRFSKRVPLGQPALGRIAVQCK